MSASSDQLQGAAAQLPVEVQVRLATSALSLRRLETLAAGDCLPLPGAFPAACAVAAGRVFADVELVESAGAVRLRVRALAGD